MTHPDTTSSRASRSRRTLAEMPTGLLQELHPLAQARLDRVKGSLPAPDEFNAQVVDGYREYQDALTWRDEIRRELAHRGLLGTPESEVA